MGLELKIIKEKDEINLTDFTIEDFVRKVEDIKGKNEYLARNINSLELFGKYSVFDESFESLEVNKLAQWAKVTAHEKSVYRKLELTLKDNNDEPYDSLEFKKAFVVEYSEDYDFKRGTIEFYALIREFNDEILKTDGKSFEIDNKVEVFEHELDEDMILEKSYKEFSSSKKTSKKVTVFTFWTNGEKATGYIIHTKDKISEYDEGDAYIQQTLARKIVNQMGLDKNLIESQDFGMVDNRKINKAVNVNDLVKKTKTESLLSYWSQDNMINVMLNTDQLNAPYQFQRIKDKIKVNLKVKYLGDAKQEFSNSNKTYKTLIEEGVKEKWCTNSYEENAYDKFGYSKVFLEVHFKEDEEIENIEEITSKQVKSKEKTSNEYEKFKKYCKKVLPIFVYSRTPKKNKDGTVEVMYSSVIRNKEWKINGVGYMKLYNYRTHEGDSDYEIISDVTYKKMVGHEFGHVFGLADAYDTKSRVVTITSEVVEEDIMRTNERVTSNNIEMLLEAVKTNAYQFYVNEYDNEGKIKKRKSKVIRLKI